MRARSSYRVPATFWCPEPVDEPGSFGAYAGPKIVRFLEAAL